MTTPNATSRQARLQPLEMGARARGAHALPDGGADGAGLRRRTSSSARTKTRRSPSARWSSAPTGRARPRSRWPSRSPTSSSARCRRRPTPTRSAATPSPANRRSSSRSRIRRRPSEVANVWYTVRKKIGDMRGTLPAGVQGPFFNDEFGDVYGVIYALESRRLQLRRTQDLRRRRAPAPAARARTWPRSSSSACRTRRSSSRCRRSAWPSSAWTSTRCWRRSARRTPSRARAPIQSPQDVVQVRVGGPVHERRAVARHADPRQFGQPAAAGRHRRDPARLRRPAGRQGAPPGQGSDRAGRVDGQGRRHHRAGQGAARRPPARSSGELPAGVKLAQVQDQPVAVAELGERVRRRADRGGGDRAGGELHRARACTRAGASAGTSTSGPGWWWRSPSRWCWP